jgi:hypothetical protein
VAPCLRSLPTGRSVRTNNDAAIPMALESGGRCRSYVPGNHSPHDGAELRRIFALFGLCIPCGFRPPGGTRTHVVPSGGRDRFASRCRQRQGLPDYFGARERLLRQLPVGIQYHGYRFPQVRARLFQRLSLRIRSREFFGECDIALRHLHIYSREAHLVHMMRSYQTPVVMHRAGHSDRVTVTLEVAQ